MISSRIISTLENVSSCFPLCLAAWTFAQIWVFYLSDNFALDAWCRCAIDQKKTSFGQTAPPWMAAFGRIFWRRPHLCSPSRCYPTTSVLIEYTGGDDIRLIWYYCKHCSSWLTSQIQLMKIETLAYGVWSVCSNDCRTTRDVLFGVLDLSSFQWPLTQIGLNHLRMDDVSDLKMPIQSAFLGCLPFWWVLSDSWETF